MPRRALSVLSQPPGGLPAGTQTIGKVIKDWIFGQPTLMAQGNGEVEWVRGDAVLSTQQKGGTGWVARLRGGLQTGWNDAAALYIPVNEMLLPEFVSAQWSYLLFEAELQGCNLGLFIHDPDDPSRRAEVSQSGAAVLLGKAKGWNSHVLNFQTPAQIFYYAEPDPIPAITIASGPGTLSSMALFQSEPIFKTWTIFRISLNMGYYNAGTFENCHLAEVIINGEAIPLLPPGESTLTDLKALQTAIREDIAAIRTLNTDIKKEVVGIHSDTGREGFIDTKLQGITEELQRMR